MICSAVEAKAVETPGEADIATGEETQVVEEEKQVVEEEKEQEEMEVAVHHQVRYFSCSRVQLTSLSLSLSLSLLLVSCCT